MKASVILPAYNAECTIKDAIDSVLNQTFKDFELIIINDGSNDNTHELISSYDDKRIVYLQNDGNRGLIYTLNRGIDTAKGEYIIRMDADDICEPFRFEKQISFMDSNPCVTANGTQIYKFGIENIRQESIPQSYEDLKYHMIINVPIFHPTAIIRKEFIDNYTIRYNQDYKHAEDYKFWIDLVKNGAIITNLDSVCLKYRISPSQISSKYNKAQLIVSQRIRVEYIYQLFKEFDCEIGENSSFESIRENWKKVFLLVKRSELILILFCMYMGINSPLYRIYKNFVTGDWIRMIKYSGRWYFRLVGSLILNKWNYMSLSSGSN